MMKIKINSKKITATIISAVSALTVVLSSLPASAATDSLTSKPGYMDNTTWNLYNCFGELYNDGCTYHPDYSDDKSHVSGNLEITSDECDQQNNYCENITKGYTFTMSQNLTTENQVIYRNINGETKEFDPGDKTLGADEDPDHNGGFMNGNFDSDGNPQGYITVGSTALKLSASGFSQDKHECVYNTTTEDWQDRGYGGYLVTNLTDNDKGTLSYLYKNVGTYTHYDEKGRYVNTKVDCKLTVVDFDAGDEFAASWGTHFMFTTKQYNNFNSIQKSCLRKLSTPIKNNKTGVEYTYIVPYMYYTKASLTGVLDSSSKYYYNYFAPWLRFRVNSVGIDQLMLNWVELRYDFYVAGTNKPIAVKGFTCWKDIDFSQGVALKKSEIDNKTFTSVGPWLKNYNPTTENEHFFKSSFIGPNEEEYIGWFEANQATTNDADEYAWLYGTFNGSSFTTLFSFAGKGSKTGCVNGIKDCSNYTEAKRQRIVQPSGTIGNDLPTISLTSGLNIAKVIKDLDGSEHNANIKTDPEIINGLSFYLKDSKGYCVMFDQNGTYTGAAELSDTELNNYSGDSNSRIFLKLNNNGVINLKNLPIDTYTIYEKADESIKNKINTDTVTTVNLAQDNNGKDVDLNSLKNVTGDYQIKHVTIKNNLLQQYTQLTVQKKTNTNKDLAGIKFNVDCENPNDQSAEHITASAVTDKNGKAVFENLPIGWKCTVTEDETTIPSGYYCATAPITCMLMPDSNDNYVNFKNIFTRISLTKVNKHDPTKKVSGAKFSIYKDVNKNGKYDFGIDTLIVDEMRETSHGFYEATSQDCQKDSSKNQDSSKNPTYLKPGYYLVTEKKAPDGYIKNPNYFPVQISETDYDKLVETSPDGYFEEDTEQNLDITKRIPLDEVNGDIWWEHGNPTFIFKTTDSNGKVIWYDSVEFTKDYVKENTFTENGKKYVEMTVSHKNIDPGTYVVSEAIDVNRYSLYDIINIKNGSRNSDTVKFNLLASDGKVTFVNTKTNFKDLTHNSIVVNHLKK